MEENGTRGTTGSKLGPILFSLYINDLAANLPSKVRPVLFADDTSVVVEGANNVNLLENITLILEKLDEWFLANKLKLNCDKTKLIVFKKNGEKTDPNLNLSYKNDVIKASDHCKFLGLELDFRLKWKDHGRFLCKKKLASACFALKSIANDDGVG
jgi:hypothetical protein